jgi:hypothetical protein
MTGNAMKKSPTSVIEDAVEFVQRTGTEESIAGGGYSVEAIRKKQQEIAQVVVNAAAARLGELQATRDLFHKATNPDTPQGKAGNAARQLEILEDANPGITDLAVKGADEVAEKTKSQPAIIRRLMNLERSFYMNSRYVSYPTNMPPPDELLIQNGGIVNYMDDDARKIIEEQRQMQAGQPDQTAINIINLRVATNTSYDFSIESEESREQQDELRRTLRNDYDRAECRPTLNAILAMLGDWQHRTEDERTEFIRTATSGERGDRVWFWCKTGPDTPLRVDVSSNGIVNVVGGRVIGNGDYGGALVSGAGEIWNDDEPYLENRERRRMLGKELRETFDGLYNVAQQN